MSKKKSFKKRPKKTAPKQSLSSSNQTVRPSLGESLVTRPAAVASSLKATAAPGTSYVLEDVKRIGAIVGGFIIVQLFLAYILNHTAFGPSVYGLIKL